MSKLLSYLIAVLLSVITVGADSFVKEASMQKSFINKWLFLGAVIYGMSCACLLALTGVFIFGEIISYLEIFGVLMGISSILILYKFS